MEVKNKKKANPHKGHRKRMWRELTKDGITENTPAHKVLELLLFFTVPRKDTNELAHTLLDHFGGSFSAVMEASVEELQKVPGITEYTASHIKLLLDITRYYEIDRVKTNGRPIKTKEAAIKVIKKRFIGARVETVYLLCLNNAGNIISCPKLAEGDECSVGLSARKVVDQVVKSGATVVLLAHNHPRGLALPSLADVKLTEQIATALNSIGVMFLDHVIFDKNDYVSMKDSAQYGHIFD